jgi:hypothetical protein
MERMGGANDLPEFTGDLTADDLLKSIFQQVKVLQQKVLTQDDRYKKE